MNEERKILDSLRGAVAPASGTARLNEATGSEVLTGTDGVSFDSQLTNSHTGLPGEIPVKGEVVNRSLSDEKQVVVTFTPIGATTVWLSVVFITIGMAAAFSTNFARGLSMQYFILLFFPGVLLAFQLAVALKAFTKRRIGLDAQGIRFSRYWSGQMFDRLNRPWHDLLLVDYPDLTDRVIQPVPEWRDSKLGKHSAAAAQGDGPILLFHFVSGGSANVQLDYLTKAEAIRILQALEQWGQLGKLSSKAAKFKEALLCDLDGPGYTELWNTDLELRHASTNFVPLSKGMTLQSGRFAVLTEIGTGGFSAVYLVQDREGNKLVLKEAVLPSHTGAQVIDKYRAAFEREARILIKLRHPKIVRVFDHFVESGRDYLVLEHISGRTLRQVVATKGPMEQGEVKQIAAEIAEVIMYLHSLEPPVVHRDLTPDNVLLKPDGSVVLIDFGAANEFLGLATGTMVGKQAYISPEQFRGKAEPRSDIYAFGATLYFLLTAQDPVPLSCSSPVKNGAVSRALCNVIEKCTQLDPENRYKSIAEVLSDLNVTGYKLPGKPACEGSLNS
jgi:tRNA A-37 threonylcarbamoyl transferase component Bud32